MHSMNNIAYAIQSSRGEATKSRRSAASERFSVGCEPAIEGTAYMRDVWTREEPEPVNERSRARTANGSRGG
jgi:hypothetical protein